LKTSRALSQCAVRAAAPTERIAYRSAMRSLIGLATGLALATSLPALGCDYPDEGTMPLRRALTRVQMLPETEAWKKARLEAGAPVQFRLLLEDTITVEKRCYWTVEALAEGKLWRRFWVTPDGQHVRRNPG
jgi:hypothetical protein